MQDALDVLVREQNATSEKKWWNAQTKERSYREIIEQCS